MTLAAWAPAGIGEVTEGADLVALLLEALESDPSLDDAARTLRDGDVVVVTSKVISKAEGRLRAGDRETSLAEESVQLVARRGPTSIVRHRLGLVLAAAGIDASHVPPGSHLLLPRDPDASARRLRAALRKRTGLRLGVLVTDTAGRAWRIGQTDLAIGAAGVMVSEPHAGRLDSFGTPLTVTEPAVADELAAAANLVAGKLSGRPIVVVRGRADLVLAPDDDGAGAAALVRPVGEDLFALGSRQAVVEAVAGTSPEAFGSPASAAELATAVTDALPDCRVAPVDQHETGPDGDLVVSWPGGSRGPVDLLRVLALAHGWQPALDAAEAPGTNADDASGRAATHLRLTRRAPTP